MNIKIFGLVGLLAFAPVAAIAAPAGGLTAQSYSSLATAPQAASNAAVAPGEATPKIEKVWWRGGWGWRGRGWGWRGGWGWRRPYGFYGGWRRPYWGWRRRWWY